MVKFIGQAPACSIQLRFTCDCIFETAVKVGEKHSIAIDCFPLSCSHKPPEVSQRAFVKIIEMR